MTTVDNLLKLKTNPLFQFSLGSKELFHSNFIAWMLETDLKFSESFLKAMGVLQKKDTLNKIKIEREKLNFDLLIHCQLDTGVKFILIENKVKSRPILDQLTEYKDKFETKRSYQGDSEFILLSLIDPEFPMPDNWKLIKYKDFAGIISQTLDLIPEDHINIGLLDFKNILREYIEFILKLSLAAEVELESKEYNLYDPKANKSKTYRELRVFDLFAKWTHQDLANDILHEIGAITECSNLKMTEKKLSKKGEYFVGTSFTKGEGITDMKIVMANYGQNRLVMGLQLQGNKLKYLVKVIGKNSNQYIEKNVSLAKALYNKKLWLIQPTWIKSMLKLKEESSQGNGRNKSHVFCEYYSGRFLYKYDELDSGNLKVDIVNVFKECYLYLQNNDIIHDEIGKIFG